MLILSRKIDEKIKIGDEITLTIIEVKGDQVKIGVELILLHSFLRTVVRRSLEADLFSLLLTLLQS